MKITRLVTILGLSVVVGMPAMAVAKTVRHSVKHRSSQNTLIQKHDREIRALQSEIDSLKSTKPQAAAPSSLGTVFSSSPNMQLKLSGQLNPAMTVVNDGYEHPVFFENNNWSTSKLDLQGTWVVNPDISVIGTVELGILTNTSNTVTQASLSGTTTAIDNRISDVAVSSKTFGTLYLGKGSSASDGTAEVDLSGTNNMVSGSGVDSLTDGIYFRSTGSSAYTSNPQVGSVFYNLDGLSRLNRLRYDSPSFYGVTLATSAGEDRRHDIALKFDQTFDGTHLAAAIAYTSPQLPIAGGERGKVLDGSASVLFQNGINATFAAGKMDDKTPGRTDPKYYFAKLGYQASWFNMGKTAMSLDYGKYSNFAADKDKGKTYGAAVVQNIDKINLALYAGYRSFLLDRVGSSFKRLDTGTLGALLKF